jgi:hypothetical protein
MGNQLSSKGCLPSIVHGRQWDIQEASRCVSEARLTASKGCVNKTRRGSLGS